MLGDLTKIATPELRKMLRRELERFKHLRDRVELAEAELRAAHAAAETTAGFIREFQAELGRRGVKILWPE